MRLSASGLAEQPPEEEQRCLNSELWHACAGPLVSLPAIGSRVVYFPQGHSEQVAASTNKEIDNQIPNYPTLRPQLICQLHNVTMHADAETDEVYAQMTLQPLGPVIDSISLLLAFVFILPLVWAWNLEQLLDSIKQKLPETRLFANKRSMKLLLLQDAKLSFWVPVAEVPIS